MKKLNSALLIFVFLLTACASNIPVEISQFEGNLTINEVRNDTDRYSGQYVRWGGTITKVENNESDTWIEVVGKNLNSYGRPSSSDDSLGRFLVRIDGFIDPAIYKTDRKITVYGVVENRVVRQIDEHPYIYPLIKAEKHYLWREYTNYPYPYPYYSYSHYYHPYYFYHPYYYHRYHFGHPYWNHHHRFHFGYFHHW